MKNLHLVSRKRVRKDHGTWYEIEIVSTYDTERGIQVQTCEFLMHTECGTYQRTTWRGRANGNEKWNGEFNSLREMYQYFGVSKYYENGPRWVYKRVTGS